PMPGRQARIFRRKRATAGCRSDRLDLLAFLPDADAAVVLLEAAGLAEVFAADPQLELAADRLAALHTDPRLRQRLDPFRRARDAAPLAGPLLCAHSLLPSAVGTLWRPHSFASPGGSSWRSASAFRGKNGDPCQAGRAGAPGFDRLFRVSRGSLDDER